MSILERCCVLKYLQLRTLCAEHNVRSLTLVTMPTTREIPICKSGTIYFPHIHVQFATSMFQGCSLKHYYAYIFTDWTIIMLTKLNTFITISTDVLTYECTTWSYIFIFLLTAITRQSTCVVCLLLLCFNSVYLTQAAPLAPPTHAGVTRA